MRDSNQIDVMELDNVVGGLDRFTKALCSPAGAVVTGSVAASLTRKLPYALTGVGAVSAYCYARGALK